jgi:AraC-like DNA-binding protein
MPDQASDLLKNHPSMQAEGLFGIPGGWTMPFGLWRARRGFDITYRPHDHASLSFVRSGGPVERLDGRFTGRKGGAHPDSFMLYPGGLSRRYRADSAVAICQIYFTSEFVGSVYEEDSGASASGLELRDDRILATDPALRRMVDLYVRRAGDTENPASVLEAESYGVLLTLHLLGHHSNRAAPPRRAARGLPSRVLQDVLDFIEANLADEVPLARIARVAGLSPRHFCTSFARSTGVTPHRYLLMRRIEKAKELMLKGERLADVAFNCGFSSQQHFTSMFRRVTTMPPGAWLSLINS